MRPRQYLSWSSLDLFEKSKERWADHYVRNKDLVFNARGKAGIDLGKEMALALENDSLTGDVALDMAILNIPKLDVMEMELVAEIKPGKGEAIPLLSRLDTARKDLSAFKEYKQGTAPWTQRKVDAFGQITFYATVIYILTGKIPADIELVWVPTLAGEDGRNIVTGDILRFRTKRTLADVLKMMVRMKKGWAGMETLTDEILI